MNSYEDEVIFDVTQTFDLGETRKFTIKGVKHDQDKPRMDLLDADALEGLARVLTFGAKKYEANNWKGGIAYSRLVASLLRHMKEIMKGNYVDEESGELHIDHVQCNAMFLSWHMKNRPDLNDLWRPDAATDNR